MKKTFMQLFSWPAPSHQNQAQSSIAVDGQQLKGHRLSHWRRNRLRLGMPLLASLGLAVGQVGGVQALPSLPSPGETNVLGASLSILTAQLSDGRVAFAAPPRLNRAYSTRHRAGEPNPTYYLTFRLPDSAAVPLSRLTVELSEGRRDFLFRYQLEATTAFAGTPDNRGAPIALRDLSQDRQQKSVTIPFEPAIAPGQTITVALMPERNPRFPGTYLFRITGFPVGDNVAPSFMGYARLGFYDVDRGGSIFR